MTARLRLLHSTGLRRHEQQDCEWITGGLRRYCCCGWMSVVMMLIFTLDWFQCLRDVDALRLAPIYWNTSNPLFKPSSKGHVIQVQPRDDIDFVCPYYAVNSTDNQAYFEYYVIYQVSKSQYDSCAITRPLDTSSTYLLLNCSSPLYKRRFTVIFDPFQAIPNVPEYLPGQTYYFISTSTGTQDGVGNVASGSCVTNNMKLAVYVCCQTEQVTTKTSTAALTTVVVTTRPAAGSPTVRDTSSTNSADDRNRNMPSPSFSSSTTVGSSSTAVVVSNPPKQTIVTSSEQRRNTTSYEDSAAAQRLTNKAVDIVVNHLFLVIPSFLVCADVFLYRVSYIYN